MRRRIKDRFRVPYSSLSSKDHIGNFNGSSEEIIQRKRNERNNDNMMNNTKNNDSVSKRNSPSPQASIIESSTSSFSGINVNDPNKRDWRRRNQQSIKEYDDPSLAELSSIQSDVDFGSNNNNNNNSKESYSFFSNSVSKSKESSFSNGSSLEQDSFVVTSTTGLFSTDNSIHSFYSYDPFTGRHDGIDRRKGENKLKDDCMKTTANPITTSKFRKGYKQHYLRAKETSKSLPRLTIPSSSNNYIEDKRKSNGTFEKNISPQSNNTASTHPITPHEENDEEFPTCDLDVTPKIHVPLNHPFDRSGKSVDSSLFTSYIMPNNSVSLSESSSNSFSSSVQLSKENKMLNEAAVEKEFWLHELRAAVIKYGHDSVETARLLDNVGSALIRCQEYTEALAVYKRMIGILSKHFDQKSLIYARALEKVGLAASKCSSQQNLQWALFALNEALHIRLSQLGPHHCDTVDTLNNIAGIFLHMKAWSRAKDLYVDVLTVRAAIFGNNHPSVAVTAQTLGKVYCHLSDFEMSVKHFELALAIYRIEPMMLRDSHPLVQRTLRNIDRTKRLSAL